jgi:FAD/FMN-containing dehydrogenase
MGAADLCLDPAARVRHLRQPPGGRGRRSGAGGYPIATFERLTALKTRLDPANVFQHNQNIPPSAG